MKKSINIYIVLPLLLIVLGATSCKGFLEQVPDDNIPQEKAMTNLDEATQVVYGIYSSFRNPALYSGALTILPDIQADFMYAAQGYGNIYGDIYRWEILSNNANAEAVYSGLYGVISRTDYFFNYADKVQQTLKTKNDRSDFDKCKGDAFMARALSYSDLIRTFCEAYDPQKATEQLGVSISEGFASKDPRPKRVSLDSSYQYVFASLDSAYKYIPATRTGSSHPFFTRGAIKALEARMKLYKQDWQGAIKAATEVIDNKVYELANANISSNGYGINDYQYLFTYDDGEEIIWKVALSTNELGGSLGNVFLNNLQQGVYVPDYVPALWVLNLYGAGDMRARSIFREIQTAHQSGLKWDLLFKYPGNPIIDNGGKPKFSNMPKVFRLSEQYLIRAEAYAHTAQPALANADLTALLRKRIANFGQTSYSGDKLLEFIKNERVRELYMEGFRLSDLKRYGQGFTRNPQTGSLAGPDALKIDKSTPLFTWPIPQHEINANPEIQPNLSNK